MPSFEKSERMEKSRQRANELFKKLSTAAPPDAHQVEDLPVKEIARRRVVKNELAGMKGGKSDEVPMAVVSPSPHPAGREVSPTDRARSFKSPGPGPEEVTPSDIPEGTGAFPGEPTPETGPIPQGEIDKSILAQAPAGGPSIISVQQAVLDADLIRVMDFPEKRRILSPWLSEQSLVLVPGWRGVGKTWFGMGACDAITHGVNFGPWETITPVPCLYIDGEMAIQDIKKRLNSFTHSEKRKAPLHFYSDHHGNSKGLPKINLLDPKWRDTIKGIATNLGVKVIVLDNLSSLCPGIDENSKLDWDPVNQWLLNLRFNDFSVIMLHHVNKEGGQRGTSAREDNIDVSIQLVHPNDYVSEDGVRFITKFSKTRIETEDLPLIADNEFSFKVSDGSGEWTFSSTKKRDKVEVLRLLSEGRSQIDISEELELSKGWVSKIRKILVKDECLTKVGTLTIKGKDLLKED